MKTSEEGNNVNKKDFTETESVDGEMVERGLYQVCLRCFEELPISRSATR